MLQKRRLNIRKNFLCFEENDKFAHSCRGIICKILKGYSLEISTTVDFITEKIKQKIEVLTILFKIEIVVIFTHIPRDC